jgi:hypothetical protein
MTKHLYLVITSNSLAIKGDTYNAKDVLINLGFKPQKVGYEWQYVKQITQANVKDIIYSLGHALYTIVAPIIKNHYNDAKKHGFAPHPQDFAWTITMIIGGREAHYFALEELLPARYESGRLVIVQN